MYICTYLHFMRESLGLKSRGTRPRLHSRLPGLEGIGTRPVSSLGNGTEAGTGPTSINQFNCREETFRAVHFQKFRQSLMRFAEKGVSYLFTGL